MRRLSLVFDSFFFFFVWNRIACTTREEIIANYATSVITETLYKEHQWIV